MLRSTRYFFDNVRETWMPDSYPPSGSSTRLAGFTWRNPWPELDSSPSQNRHKTRGPVNCGVPIQISNSNFRNPALFSK